MKWRDIRFDKPTAADGDAAGMVAQMIDSGKICTAPWDDLRFTVAWMPTSELPAFERIPDPPDGWRFRQEGEAFDRRAQYWNYGRKQWVTTLNLHRYSRGDIYIVPIDPPAPPEPQYRPFANAAEFAPYRDEWFNRECGGNSEPGCFNISGYDDIGFWCGSVRYTYKEWFENGRKFADGTPFGVRIDQ
jgi:hypothetical protein